MKKFAIGNMVRVTNKVYGDGKKYDGDLDYDMGIDYTSYYFVPRLAGKQGKIIDIKNGVYKLDFAQRFGNCFKTQREAEQASNKIKALLLSQNQN